MSQKKGKKEPTLTQEEIEDLLKKAKAGSLEAQNSLIINYKNAIMGEASRFERKEHQKEDFLQEGRLALLRAIKTYNEEKNKSFFNYAKVCIRNALIDWHIKEKKAPLISQFCSLEDDEKESEKLSVDANFALDTISEEETEQIGNLLKETLSKRQRDVFVLFANEYTYKEIANILDLTEKQVDNALRKAREKLRENDKIKKVRERHLKNKTIIKNK